MSFNILLSYDMAVEEYFRYHCLDEALSGVQTRRSQVSYVSCSRIFFFCSIHWVL